MMKAPSIAAVILALGASMLSGLSQEAAKKEVSPKPPLTGSQAVLESWNDIGRKLIAMAEDFPEDKYDFKPTPAQLGRAAPARCRRELLLHQSGPGPKPDGGRRSQA